MNIELKFELNSLSSEDVIKDIFFCRRIIRDHGHIEFIKTNGLHLDNKNKFVEKMDPKLF